MSIFQILSLNLDSEILYNQAISSYNFNLLFQVSLLAL